MCDPQGRQVSERREQASGSEGLQRAVVRHSCKRAGHQGWCREREEDQG